jgi:hypothetical protein
MMIWHGMNHCYDKSKDDEVGGICNMHGEGRNAYKIPVGKPEGERPF